MSNPEVKIRLALDGASQVQAGVDATAASLGKLSTAASQAGKGVQLSGQQMAQVSAQLQDLFIQIQGGQAPLTALLQQGSQLNTVFGGTGAALRAVGGTLLGLLNPLTLAAGALGALAFAYKQGSAETDVYRRALVLTGGAAGVTVGQLQAMARAQAEVAGTQGKAAEALGVLAANGKVAGEQLGMAADAAIRLERLADIPIEQTAKKFADLGKTPLEALVKLNEAENFLTRSVYEQVKALEKQGDMAGAAAAAQSAYADALKSRSQEIEENLGSIERGWLAVTDTAKKAWDAMLNVGRPGDPIAEAQKKLDILRDKATSPYRDADDARQLAQAEKVMKLLLAQRDAKAQGAKEQAEGNKQLNEEI
ncbi:MAG: phage tail length tape measure family protein, partial [Inhella sp.]